MNTKLASIALILGFSPSSSFAAEAKNPSITIAVTKDIPIAIVTKVIEACQAADVNDVTLVREWDETKTQSIRIAVSEDFPYVSLVEIIEACKDNGVENISVMRKQPKEQAK